MCSQRMGLSAGHCVLWSVLQWGPPDQLKDCGWVLCSIGWWQQPKDEDRTCPCPGHGTALQQFPDQALPQYFCNISPLWSISCHLQAHATSLWNAARTWPSETGGPQHGYRERRGRGSSVKTLWPLQLDLQILQQESLTVVVRFSKAFLLCKTLGKKVSKAIVGISAQRSQQFVCNNGH